MLPAPGAANPDLRLRGAVASGSAAPVPDGLVADLLLTADASGGIAVLDLRGGGVSREALPTLDLAHTAARLEFDGVPARALPGGASTLAGLRAKAAVLAAFEQLGGAQRCLDLAVAYAKERHAFGQPIGAFQAIKHKLAGLYVEIELTRANCYYGAWALEQQDAQELTQAACHARVLATDTYLLAAEECIHVHGGTGFTWDCEAHLHLRRARALEAALGPAAAWREALLRIPGAVPGF
jgi:alkylation response protein AidB-like acyl-CoA dehydrogenase